MAVIPYNQAGHKLLARLMRAEAEGEVKSGMLTVGNKGVNRVRGDCIDFTDINCIRDKVFQSPGGFEATQKGYFYQRAREQVKRLTRRVIMGERVPPATNSLWFFKPSGACPAQWFEQWNTGRFESHCFYSPTRFDCPSVY